MSDEIVIPFSRFVSVPMNTPAREFRVVSQKGARTVKFPAGSSTKARLSETDQVWTKLLKNRHGSEKHTVSGWMNLLSALKQEKV